MRRAFVITIAAIPLLAGATMIAVPSRALAAATTWTVTGTADDAGNVACNATADTCASLRDAVTRASADDAGDTISLSVNTYSLTNCSAQGGGGGALDVKGSMIIQGQGSGNTIITGGTCVTGGPWNDPLIINSNCASLSLTISGVTLTGGDATGSGPSGNVQGGAVSFALNCSPNPQTVAMNDVNVASNTAESGGGVISAWASLALTNVTFGHDTATHADGGALYFQSRNHLSMTNVYAHDNSEGPCSECGPVGGGAFFIDDTNLVSAAPFTATNVLLERNTASDRWGGAVFELGSGTIDWNNVTMDANQATPDNSTGGAVYLRGVTSNFTNTTADDNTAGEYGGAFAIGFIGGTLNVLASTINDNNASTGNGGAFYTDSGAIKVTQSILYNNQADSSVDECEKTGLGSFASGGYNLADDATCGLVHSTDTQNTSMNPLLASLATNAVSSSIPPIVGATADSKALSTEALQTGSPAINQVPSSVCPPPTTDERGVTRAQGPACEIGAFEVFVPPPSPTAAPATPSVPATGRASVSPFGPLAVALTTAGAALVVVAATVPVRRRRRHTP